MKTAIKFVAILMILGLALIAMPAGKVSAAADVNCTTGCDQTQIQAAIDAAAPGATITVSGGPYVLTAAINLNKAVTLSGVGNPLIQVSGTGYKIIVTAAGVTLQGFQIQGTDNADQQQFIHINASNVTISNNKIWGQWVIGNGEVSRAMVISGGLSGLLISNNEIYGLRQPGYVSGTTTGLVSNNTVHGTKGWVLEGGNLTFTGNTFSGNVGDIAIIPDCPSIYYTDILALSAANNNAVVEDQRVEPRVLSVAYVDVSAPAGGNGTQASPLQTINAGIARVIAGGTVYVADGTYNYDTEGHPVDKGLIKIPKAVTLKAKEDGNAIMPVIDASGAGGLTNDGVFKIYATQFSGGTVIIEGFDITGIPQTGIAITAPMYQDPVNPNTIIIRNNKIHGMIGAIDFWGTTTFVTDPVPSNAVASHIVIDNNEIYDMGVAGIAEGLGVMIEDPAAWAVVGSDYAAKITNNVFSNIVSKDAATPGAAIVLPRADSGTEELNVLIQGNTINSTVIGVGVGVTGGSGVNHLAIDKNKILNTGFGVLNLIAETVDASPNWWGQATGPTASQMSGSMTYIPWCTNPECTEFGGPVTNVTRNTFFSTIQAAINDAATVAGDVIEVAPGVYNESVNVTKGVTLLGKGENRDFSAPITVGAAAAPGVWYPDRYKPAVFETAIFNGEPVLKHGVRIADSAANRPSSYSSAFYNTQGRKLDVNLSGPIQTASIDLWVDPAWATTNSNAGFWGTGFDSTGGVSAYPILAWRNVAPDAPGFYIFDYIHGGYILLKAATPADYGRWHTLSYTLNVGTGVNFFVDGGSKVSFADPDTKTLSNVILNVYNFGADYDVYWDNFATYDASIVGQMTISASNVKVDGFDMSNPGQAYGIMIDPTVSDIQIMHNRIHDVGGAAVENAKGVYLRMGPDNVTLEGNLFSSIVAGIRSANAIFAGDSNSTDPSTGLVIRNNSFVNITAVKGAYGILLNNGAADTGGGTPGAEIEGNRFSDLLGGWTHAIGLEGPTDGAVVLRNTFSGLNTTGGSPDNVAVFFEDNPVGNTVAVTKNQFLNSGYGVAVAGTYTVNASPNWWGLATGPVATQMGGTLTTSPWCAVPDCSILNPHTVGSEGLQKVLDTAPSYTTIIVPGITYSDGSSIGYHIDTPHLTIILKNGTVIQNNSPCFTVNASYTTITTESIGGAKCIPTGGSNGIDVNAGLVNVILQGMEIDGTGQSTGAGINFAGAIEDVQVLDNNIHNLGGDGLKFNVQPLNVVDIRGNMFKSNTGLGVNNLGTSNIDATYNSWGSQAGPGSGDGVSSHVLYDPWTNVDLFLGSSGTPWAFQVVKNSNISITVMGDLYRVTGASFKLEYDTSLLDLVSATPTALFNAVPPSGTLLNTATDGVVQYDGIKFTEVTGTDMAFYTLVLKGTATGTAYVRFNTATDLFAMSPTSGPSSNIYANTLTPGSVKIITLPTLNSTDIQGYYLTGDRQEFNISLTNPAAGGDFSKVIVKYSVSGLQKADIATFEYNAGGTWVAMGSRSTETYLEDSVLNKVYGEFGLAPLGFPMAPGFSDPPQFRVTFNTAGSYPVTLELVDRLASDAVLATFTSTAVVYAKPVITSPNLAGPYLAGIPQAATINITNPSLIPAPFNLVLALPAGTTVVYNSVAYTCTSSGCIIPVLLPAASNSFPLTITFNAPYSGPVTATLFDSDWTPSVHELAHLTVDPVIAYANFSLKGTISMQGRTLRAGAQMKLTGPTGFAYGPFTATSIEQISKNLSWSLIPQATYTLTTYQPRYLNLIAANNKTALVNGALVFNPLELKGGNCVWSDNEIGVGDASCVGGKYGTGTILDDADVNFDGKVNIQDLALVGGNFYATSQTSYGIGNSSIWIPLP